jgi:bacterioferritin
MSEKAQDILRFDLENKKETIRNYRQRIKQADALGIDAPKIED